MNKHDDHNWLRRIGATGGSEAERRRLLLSRAPNGVRRFFKKHGNYVLDEKRRNYLFQDGARIEIMFGDFGSEYEPPTDKHECAKIIAKFYAVKNAAARNKFRLYQQTLLGEGTGVVAIFENSEEAQMAKLKKLRNAARKARERWQEAVQEVNETEPAYKAAGRRQDAENKQKQSDRKHRIRGIKL